MKRQLFLLLAGLSLNYASAQIDINTPADLQACAEFNTATFDLSAQIPGILGSLSASDYTVTFHTSQASATADTGAVSNPSAYSGGNQEIYVRVEENANPVNFETTSFSLVVNTNPYVYPMDFTACDFDNAPADGNTLVDLEEIAEQVYWYSSIEPTDMEIVFFASEADAMANINGLESPYLTGNDAVIYARNTYYATGCFKVIPVTMVIEDCSGQCNAPQNLAVSQITGSTATFSWDPVGDETQWELLVLYSGGPFPLPTMDGIVVDDNPVTLSGLECPESFDVYIRAVCDLENSNWSQAVTFETTSCGGGGLPNDLEACGASGTACFDLTVNNAVVLGQLDPADHTISYHLSSADATSGTNAISTPAEYCTTVSASATIYMRVENNISGEVQIWDFTIDPVDVLMAPTPLQPLIQCDEDGDDNVIFDLTTAGPAGTSNTLEYYSSSSDAYDQLNAITTASAWEVSTNTPLTTIYIREDVTGSCDIIHVLQVNALANCNFSNVCAGANSLCSALGQPFLNAVGIESAELGNNYGCLDETPNPTWFTLPVSSAGTISLQIEQSSDISENLADLDVDFIVYGPFDSALAPCAGQLTADKIVDCSYSGEFTEYATIPNAQPGEFYLMMTSNYSDETGYITITDAGNSQGDLACSGLRLNAFIDENSNGVKDGGESGFALGGFQYVVNDSDDTHNITSPSGIHRIYDFNADNSYDISFTVDPMYASYYGIATSSVDNLNVVEGAGLQDVYFPLSVSQSYNDLSITLIPDEAPRPGFTYNNTIVYTNLGTSVASGSLTFEKDDMVTILSTSEAGITTNATGFTYSFTNLQPFETRSILVTMQVPVIPTIELGDMLTNTVSIEPIAGDVSPENNESISTQEVIGSYDPNDKIESRGDRILISEFGPDDYLYYTIRFENTGTASAINIRISDILDDQLDETTVSMISASHDYTLDRVDNRLTWRFDNVQLPPTIEDPVGSHGYVHFRVKPMPGFELGDVIPNTASIYFDFNPAIVTNTFTSMFVNSLAVNENSATELKVWPNPAGSYVNISIDPSNTISKIRVYDLPGKVVLEQNGTGSTEVIQTGSLTSGIYLLEITASDKATTTKKLIIK